MHDRRRLTIGSLLLALLVHAAIPPANPAFSQEKAASVAPAANEPESIPETAAESPGLAEKLGSPRTTIRTFQAGVAPDGDKADAALCLDQQAANEVNTDETVHDLKRVLTAIGPLDIDRLPNLPTGRSTYRLNDALTYGASAGVSPQTRKLASQVELARDNDGLWRFSRDTVLSAFRLAQEAAALPDTNANNTPDTRPWSVVIRDLFPTSLQSKHFLLRDDQWLCLFLLIFVGFAADMLVRFTLHMLAATWFRLRKGSHEYTNERRLWRPLGILAQALVWYWGTLLLGLPDFAQTILLYGLKVFAIVAAVWTAFLLIDLFARFLVTKAAHTETKFDDLLIPLISKSLKVFAVCMGALTCAQAFNLPIAGLIGGLGIGGAAIAFASKDAISNLFGSITVLTDRPFEIGDWIKTDGVEGTVETVGFRSSRIRTFYNSQITLPNSRLTTAVVDNMGRRRYRRITATLGVQYDTTPEQIDAFCEGVRELIRRHPYTRKDYYHVYLNGFSASSLDIMLYCFVECPDWSVELREKHRLYLDIVRLAKSLEVSFAFPTRTLHLFQEEEPPMAEPIESARPHNVGQKLAAQIAGPLVDPDHRPGPVQFTGPTELD